MLRIAIGLALAAPLAALSNMASAQQEAPVSHQQLQALFADWRAFQQPAMVDGIPDYGAPAMAQKAQAFPALKARLAAIDTTGWTLEQRNDLKLVQAEMNGLDFYFRILQPWSRDPGFYLTVFPDMSDVPAHEGTYAEPVTDFFKYRWPLSAADQAKLAAQLETVPLLLIQAKANLAPSTAHDLWAYGAQGFYDQADSLARLEAKRLPCAISADFGRSRSRARRRGSGKPSPMPARLRALSATGSKPRHPGVSGHQASARTITITGSRTSS